MHSSTRLLSINIPTYERLAAFSGLVKSLSCQLKMLDVDIQGLVAIAVFDNNSECWVKKQLVFHEAFDFNERHVFIKNKENIGGDANIVQCCSYSQDSLFTWVLGDDEQLRKDALKNILNILTDHLESLGLLILNDDNYFTDPVLFGKEYFRNYEEFAQLCIKHQPHALIAHSLISCNIFRTSLFSNAEGIHASTDLKRRHKTGGTFAHLRGLIFCLLRNNGNQYSVVLHQKPTIDTSRRLPSVDMEQGEWIHDVFYFHMLWLLSELGVRISDVDARDGMGFLLEKSFLNNSKRLRRKIKGKVLSFAKKLAYFGNGSHCLKRFM